MCPARTYRTTFTIPAGTNLAEASIRGSARGDNDLVAIILNGVSTGNSNLSQFTEFSQFEIAGFLGDSFLPGINTLTFIVNNGPGAGPGGLRVEFDQAVALVPEPSTGLLALLAAAGLMLRRR